MTAQVFTMHGPQLPRQIDMKCRTCGAEPGRLCRSKAGNTVKILHVARRDALHYYSTDVLRIPSNWQRSLR